METAIRSTSLLGFILRDLDQEFFARFTDELLLVDKNTKALASPNITTRANLNAHIGEGNMHFLKYSVLGHVYLLIQILLDEAKTPHDG